MTCLHCASPRSCQRVERLVALGEPEHWGELFRQIWGQPGYALSEGQKLSPEWQITEVNYTTAIG